jgi:hypothetical protein
MGLREEITRLVNDGSARHKRLIDYTLRQVRIGRPLAEVLEDPYVINRASPLERRALLEEPKIVDAVRDDVLNDLRARLEALVKR